MREGAPALTKLEWQKRLRGADLTPVEFMVLTTIATYTDGDLQHAHPGWTRLHGDTGLDERTLKHAAARLTAKGFLSLTTPGGNQYAKGQANEYSLTLPAVHKGDAPCTPCDDEEGVHPVQARGAVDVGEGGHGVYPHQVLSSGHASRSSSNVKFRNAGARDAVDNSEPEAAAG